MAYEIAKTVGDFENSGTTKAEQPYREEVDGRALRTGMRSRSSIEAWPRPRTQRHGHLRRGLSCPWTDTIKDFAALTTPLGRSVPTHCSHDTNKEILVKEVKGPHGLTLPQKIVAPIAGTPAPPALSGPPRPFTTSTGIPSRYRQPGVSTPHRRPRGRVCPTRGTGLSPFGQPRQQQQPGNQRRRQRRA